MQGLWVSGRTLAFAQKETSGGKGGAGQALVGVQLKENPGLYLGHSNGGSWILDIQKEEP